jgi:hypothetical protein
MNHTFGPLNGEYNENEIYFLQFSILPILNLNEKNSTIFLK